MCSLGEVRAEGGEEPLPPLAMAAQERGIRHCVTGGMVVGHRFPSAMLDRNPGFRANRLEGNVYVGDLIRGEAHLASREGEPDAGLPDRDPADLEDAAIGVCLGERPAFARLEGGPIVAWHLRR